MPRSLYSLLLDDEVVREIDSIAMREGMSRSALCNRILAEYAAILTPEEKIHRIFEGMSEALGACREIVVAPPDRRPVLSMRTSLDVKYRPTVRYEVELYRTPEQDGSIGTISILYRTTSPALLEAMNDFFLEFRSLERKYLPAFGVKSSAYSGCQGRLVRSICPPAEDYQDIHSLAQKLSEYVSMIDRLLKLYLASGKNISVVEREYLSGVSDGTGRL